MTSEKNGDSCWWLFDDERKENEEKIGFCRKRFLRMVLFRHNAHCGRRTAAKLHGDY